MQNHKKTNFENLALYEDVKMRERQLPIRNSYETSPEKALITDHARSTASRIAATQPLYGSIEFGEHNPIIQNIALHEGVGGYSDLPVPGDIFCGAIAGCLDSAIRVIANHLNIQLADLEVKVEADADLRGALRMDSSVQIGFKAIRVHTRIVPENDVPAATLNAILTAAEGSCVILQTLRNPPKVEITTS